MSVLKRILPHTAVVFEAGLQNKETSETCGYLLLIIIGLYTFATVLGKENQDTKRPEDTPKNT